MKKIFLCISLFLGALFADVRVPKPWNPGFFECLGANPARTLSGFDLGFVWTEPMEGVDYEVFGFASEWGNGRYRLEASFASSFLDSLFRGENFGLETSLAFSKISVGFGGNFDIRMVPGVATWWRAVGRTGLAWNENSLFSGGIWGNFPSDFEKSSLAGNILWNPGRKFWSELAFLYRRPFGLLVVFGEKIRIGALELSGSVAYPGPRIGVGVSLNVRSWGVSFGVHRDGDYMDSRMGGLFYRRVSGSQAPKE